MKAIITAAGLTWAELETEGDAREESDLARHAVFLYFMNDRKRENEGGAGARYFSLREGGRSLVTVRIPNNQENRKPGGHDGMIVVGPQNLDPFPDRHLEILALSEALDIDLPADCYPYSSR